MPLAMWLKVEEPGFEPGETDLEAFIVFPDPTVGGPTGDLPEREVYTGPLGAFPIKCN